MYHTYILRCADDTLYVGSTNKLEKRLHEHNSLKSGAHYTKIRRPVALEYSQECADYAQARALEAEWKRMSRAQKLYFIEANKTDNIAI
jgi:predicted GIY-YIG superfamily endonuclease